jgi:hypothetical protein
MRSFQCIGIFTLSGGHHVSSVRTSSSINGPTSKPTNHVVYSSLTFASNGDEVDGSLRLWAPRSAPVLPDNTLAFVVGKVQYVREADNVRLDIEAVTVVAFPGDPESDHYENGVPDLGGLLMIVLGTTTSSPTDTAAGRTFTLTTSDYVRDVTAESTIWCV